EQGDRCRDQGQWQDACEWYRLYLREQPGDFLIWIQLGNCLKESGNYDDALSAYCHAIVLNGDDADVFLQLGHLHKARSYIEDAIGAYRASVARRSTQNPATDELAALNTVPYQFLKSTEDRARLRPLGLFMKKKTQVRPSQRPPAESAFRSEGDRYRDLGQ